MHVPPKFRPQSPDQVSDFLKSNGFGILVSVHNSLPIATHIPLVFKQNAEHPFLEGHISRGNEQSLQFTNNEQVLVIFQGEHSYISSSWYEKVNVPTWNYSAVHVYGKIQLIKGEEFYNSLKNLTDKYEEGNKHRFYLDHLPEKMLKREMRGIVGFKIIIDKIDAAFKMSQNRNEKDYENIIAELEKKGDPQSLAVAKKMNTLNS